MQREPLFFEIMRIRERIKEMLLLMSDVQTAVLEGKIPSGTVSETLASLLVGKEKPWWEVEKRYKSWVLEPITPELLNFPDDHTFEHAFWKKCSIPHLDQVPGYLLGAEIYFHLYMTNVLPFTPSIEALDFYEHNPELRKKVWDRTGNWVFAWRDAVISRRPPYNILVPGMFVKQHGKIVIRRWVPLHDIYKKVYKVLFRC